MKTPKMKPTNAWAVVDKDFDAHAWHDENLAIEGCISIYDKRHQARYVASSLSKQSSTDAPFTVVPVTIIPRKAKP